MSKLADDITIRVAGRQITLRPTLGCAIRLERRPGSFAGLTGDVLDGSLTAAVTIIRDHADLPDLERHVLTAGLDRLQDPLIRYVMACAGIDAEPDKTPAKAGKSVTFAEYLAGLYRIATGWLGWTPMVALDSTPAEITHAYEGRLDMLKAIFGTADTPAKAAPAVPLDDKLKAAFSSFGTTIVTRQKAG